MTTSALDQVVVELTDDESGSPFAEELHGWAERPAEVLTSWAERPSDHG